MTDLVPLGDRAFLARFPNEADARAWSETARTALAAEPGVEDVVLAYATAAVYADPDRVDLAALESRLRTLVPVEASVDAGTLIELPVLYEGEDLPEVAERLGLREDAVVATHSGTIYHVFAVGFQPGFPYAGYLPAALSGLARRESPRARVLDGSVAIAGRQTGVYPVASPGGWHLIGRTPLQIVDLQDEHFPIRAGDRLRFIPMDRAEYSARLGERLDPRGSCPTAGRPLS